MPVNVKFNIKDFVIHPKLTQEWQDFMLILDRGIIGINNSPQKEPTRMYVFEKLLMDALPAQ